MKKILLIVSSHEDASLLPQAAKAIGKLGCGMLWVWHSPILGIDPTKECKTIDDELRALAAGERDARERRDYKTAEECKAEQEKLQLNRSVEVRNAWKRASEENRKSSVGKYMEPLLNILNPKRDPKGMAIRISSFPEHQEPDLWIAGVNEVKAVLEKDGFRGGTFALMWPKQLAGLLAVAPMDLPPIERIPRVSPQQKAEYERVSAQPKVPVPPMTFDPDIRRTQLNSFQPSKVIYTAKRLGIKTKLKENAQLIQEILTAEALNAM